MIWWTWPGSNRRPPACKAGALPAELHAHEYQVIILRCFQNRFISFLSDPVWVQSGSRRMQSFVTQSEGKGLATNCHLRMVTHKRLDITGLRCYIIESQRGLKH
jgi:hypothetical protein